MKPVNQKTKFDCFRASAASILELDLEKVPDIAQRDGKEWRISETVEQYKDAGFNLKLVKTAPKDTYVIGVLVNKNNGRSHAVVIKNGIVEHNPDKSVKINGLTLIYIFTISKNG